MSKFSQEDIGFMKRALELAHKGFGKVSPNPMVGAVLVKKNRIIAEGYHHKYGAVHAEVDALKNLTREQISGSTLYVTLEPCAHFGKQPPCANFLIDKGVKRLFIAMRDPNPLVAGKGIKLLKNAGVSLEVGLLNKEAVALNKVFVKNITTQLPFVTIKLGTTLDGKIALLDGRSKYITGRESLHQVHKKRSHTDALLTTSETVLKDNPHLGVRDVKGKDPLRIVIDSTMRTGLDAVVYRDNHVVVATTMQSSIKKRLLFEKKGISVLVYDSLKIPLKKLLKDLYEKHKVTTVMTEAGSSLISALLKEKLADELMLFVAPKILGRGLSWTDHFSVPSLDKAFILQNEKIDRFGDDLLIAGDLQYN